MSARKARRGDQVHLELSDMHLALNMAKMSQGGFRTTLPREHNTWLWNPVPKSEKRWCGDLSLLGIERWRLCWKDTWRCFVNTTWMDALLAEMALRRICRHTGGAKNQLHLTPTISDSRHQNQRHLCLQFNLHHPVRERELRFPKSIICYPDMCIHTLLFPALNFSISMHMPRIASMIPISIQTCGLMKEHPLVSTLSAVR